MNKASNKKIPLTIAAISLFLMALLWSCAPEPSQSAEAQDTSSGEATDTSPAAWTPDMDCATCHAEAEDHQDSTISSYHINNQSLNCLSCHKDTADLKAAHSDMSKKSPTKLKKTSVEEETCLSCHDAEELKSATAQSTVLTDDNGTVVNPHDIPKTAEHDTACSDCHKGHGEKPASEEASSYCTGCHHAGVYECNTCH